MTITLIILAFAAVVGIGTWATHRELS